MKVQKKRMLSAMLAMALLVATAAGAFMGPQLTRAQDERPILQYGVNAADLTTLDPHFASATQDRTTVDMVFNGLIRFQPGNSAEFEPDLAVAIPEPEMDGEQQVWTFELREGVMCHPGLESESYELTADDVVYSLQKSADPDRSAFAGEYTGMSVEALDEYTVQITMEQALSPTLFLPKVADYAGGFIVCSQAYEAMDEETARTNPVGTGPFMFESYTPMSSIELVANDDYFRGEPALGGVSLQFVAEISSRELALQAGDLDVIAGLGEVQWVERINELDGIIADVFGVGEVVFIQFNLNHEPIDDPLVREAIALAIDRDEHLALFGEPVAENVYSVVPAQLMPGGLTQEEAEERGVAFGQDLDRARELLEEAGYADGLSLDVVTSEMEVYRTNYEVLQAELEQIGIELNITVVDHSTMHEQIREDVNPIIVYVAFRPNADVYLQLFFHSDSIVVTGASPVTNFAHYDQIDDLIEQARVETDPEVQEEMWRDANTQILEDLAAYPLHFQNQVYARTEAVDYGHELVSSLALYPQITELTTLTEE